MKHKAEIILRCLLRGQEVTLNGYKTILADTEAGQELFVVSVNDPNKLLCYELTLGQFLKACDKLSDDEIFVLGAEGVLTDLNRSR